MVGMEKSSPLNPGSQVCMWSWMRFHAVVGAQFAKGGIPRRSSPLSLLPRSVRAGGVTPLVVTVLHKPLELNAQVLRPWRFEIQHAPGIGVLLTRIAM